MATIELNGTKYGITDAGSGPAVIFGHSLLADRQMFDHHVALLSDRYRCIAIDWLGHGESGARLGGWTLQDMAADTALLIDRLELDRAAFVGAGQGGMVFMHLLAEIPVLAWALIMLGASATGGRPEFATTYRPALELFRTGTREQRMALAPFVLSLFHSAAWRSAHPAEMAAEINRVLDRDSDEVYRACSAVLARDHMLDRIEPLGSIPTLVIAGAEDVATPRSELDDLAAAIPGASTIEIPGAGHFMAVEEPEVTGRAIERFLASVHTAAAGRAG